MLGNHIKNTSEQKLMLEGSISTRPATPPPFPDASKLQTCNFKASPKSKNI